MADSVQLGAAHVTFTADFKDLMKAIDDAVRIAKQASGQIEGALSGISAGAKRTGRTLAAEFAKAATASVRSWNAAVQSIRAGLRKLTSELVFIQLDISHIANMLQRMAMVGTAAIGGMAAASMSFEDAFANVRKTVDASEAEFRQLEQSLRQMSTQTRTSASDLALIMSTAGQLGVRGADNLTKFTRTIDMLQVATNIVGQEGAQALAQFMNIMQESLGNVDRVGAAITELGNNFAATEADILNMAQRLAGAGKTVGLTTADVLGLATALSAVGIRAEMGGSALSRVLINMSQAVETNDERLREFARTAGMSAREFADTFRRDPVRALQAFIEGLRRLDSEGKNVFATLENVGASEIRVRDTVLRLFQASDLLADAVERSNRAWEENIALTEEFERFMGTGVARLRVMWNTIVEVARIVGDVYNPVIKQAADFTQGVADALRRMTPEQQQAIAEFGALATAALGGIAAFLLAIKTITTFATGLVLLTRAVVFFLSPWTLLTMAVIAAAIAIESKWDEIAEMIRQSDWGQLILDSWEKIKAIWSSDTLTLPEKTLESVRVVVNTVVGLIESITDWFVNAALDLARDVAVSLGLDRENSKLVRLIDDIQAWWNEESRTLVEKGLGIVAVAVTVNWLISFLRPFIAELAARAGLAAAAGASAQWLVSIGRVAVAATIGWILLPDDIKEEVTRLWNQLGEAILNFNEDRDNPFVELIGRWLRDLEARDWQTGALTIGVVVAGFAFVQSVSALLGMLGAALAAKLAGGAAAVGGAAAAVGAIAVKIALPAVLITGIGVLSMDPETRSEFLKKLQDSLNGLKRDLQQIWDKFFGEEWGEALRRAREEGRLFDPITVFIQSVTDSIQAFRSSLRPIQQFLYDWIAGMWMGVPLRDAFERGVKSQLDPRAAALFESLIDFGMAIWEFIQTGIAANADIVLLVSHLFVGSLSRVATVLLEVGASWAGELIQGLVEAVDTVSLVKQLFVVSLSRVATTLIEVGASWADMLIQGLKEQFENWDFERWFAGTLLGKWIIERGWWTPGFMQESAAQAGFMQGSTAQAKLTDDEMRALAGFIERGRWTTGAMQESTTQVKLTETEIRALAALVHAEAAGEPFEGKVAVAEVVLNRLRSRHFPNTLEEVIRQPWQFEPVMSGRYDEILKSQRDLTEELRAVRVALEGSEFAKGALFFFNPVIVAERNPGSWMLNPDLFLTYTEIGRHRFGTEIRGGKPLGYKDGVILPGFGGGDRIPALLEAGEAVVPARVVRGGLADIVAWFRRMGVVKMQTGGIVGADLAALEAEYRAVSADMTQFANRLLEGIKEITDTLSAWIFGAAQLIVDVLKALFPDHADAIQQSFESFKAMWERWFRQQPQVQEDAVKAGIESAQPQRPAPSQEELTFWQKLLAGLEEFTLTVQQEWQKIAAGLEALSVMLPDSQIADAMNSFYASIQRMGKVVEFFKETVEGESGIKNMIDGFHNILTKAHEVFESLAEGLGPLGMALTGFFMAGGRGISGALGAIGGFLTQYNPIIGLGLTLIGGLINAIGDKSERVLENFPLPDPGKDILSIGETWRRWSQLEENQRRLEEERSKLVKQHEQIRNSTIGGAALGAIVGGILFGPLGALLGGIFGGSAGQKAAEKSLESEIKRTEEEIRRLTELIHNAKTEIINALGISMDDFARGIAAAFRAPDIDSFAQELGKSVREQIRNALVQVFIAQILEPQIKALAEMVQAAFLEGKPLNMEAIDKHIANIVEISRELYERFDELGLTSEQLNDSFSRMIRNIPQGYRVEKAIFEASPPRIPALASGGIVTRPTLALVGEAGPEAVVPLDGSGFGTINITIQRMEVQDGRDFGRRLDEELRRRGLVRAGNVTAWGGRR